MPIGDSEWRDGTLDNANDEPETVPVEDRNAENERIEDFLQANDDRAYTAREVLVGVGFDADEDADTVGAEVEKASPRTHVLGEVGDDVEDPVGDLVGDDTELSDIQSALDDLVEEGTAVTKEVETDEGTETYYRYNTGGEQVDG